MGDKDVNYIIERAQRSNGICSACRDSISKGELRLNVKFWIEAMQCFRDKRRHIGCITGRVALNALNHHGSLEALPGFEELSEEEQKELEEHFLSAIGDEATEGLARKKIGSSRKRVNACQEEAVHFLQQHNPGALPALQEEAELIAAAECQLKARAKADPEKAALKKKAHNRKRAKTEELWAGPAAAGVLEAGGVAGAAAGVGAGLLMPQPLLMLPGLLPGLNEEEAAAASAAPGLVPGAAAAASAPPGGLGAAAVGQPGSMGLLPQMAQLQPAQLLAINAFLTQMLLARQAAAGLGAGSAAAGGTAPDAAAASAAAAGCGVKPEPLAAKDEIGIKPEPLVKQERAAGLLGTGTAIAAAAGGAPPPVAGISPQVLASPQLLAPGTPTRQLSAVLATTIASGGYAGGYASGPTSGGTAHTGDGDGAVKPPPLRVSARRRKAPVRDDVFLYGDEAEMEQEQEAAVGWGGNGDCGVVAAVKARGGGGRSCGRAGRRGRIAVAAEDPDYEAE